MDKKFIGVVGLFGSGKSTQVEKLLDLVKDNDVDVSVVFDAKAAENSLKKEEEIIIYDGMSCSSGRQRKHIVEQAKRHGYKCVCYLMATPIGECLLRQFSKRQVDWQRAWEEAKKFQVPSKFEGWDCINVCEADCVKENIQEIFDESDIPQDNKHHTLTIKEHMENARDCFFVEMKRNEYFYSFYLATAVLYHDIGKLDTKTFSNANGEVSEEAHYYGHENLGAYYILTGDINFLDDEERLRCALLVNLHMQMHDERRREKLEKFFTEKDVKFWCELCLLHDCDKK